MKENSYELLQKQADKFAALEQLLSLEESEALTAAKGSLQPEAKDREILKAYEKNRSMIDALTAKQHSLADQLHKRGWSIRNFGGDNDSLGLLVLSSHPTLAAVEEKFARLRGLLKKFRLLQQAEMDAEVPAEIRKAIGMD